MKLRAYQSKAIQDVLEAFKRSDRVVLVLPTGAGKTVVASRICREMQPVVWAAHRKELLGQAEGALQDTDYSTISAFATKAPNQHYKLLVIDEFHHEACRSYRKLMNKLTYDKLLGITATRYRLDNLALRFDEVIEGTTTEHLIEEGYLAPMRLVRVRSSGKVLDDLITWTNLHQPVIGQTIFFVPDLEAAQYVSENLTLSNTIVSGESDRDAQLALFRREMVQCLISCMVLTEGVDLPMCRTAVLGRSTHSATLLSQMVGRALRLFKGKEYCNIVEPALLYSQKKYISVSDIITPNDRIIASPNVFQGCIAHT
jgi:superfamily II DNA or RNA helicase